VVFKGYYKDEEKTKEAFDDEGWFCTGDVCRVDEYGRLKIIDRVKNFFKLAQGEYVGPEKIENIYSASPLLAQIFVHGDGLQSYLVAIVGVNPQPFARFASQVLGTAVGEDPDSIAEAGRRLKVKKAFIAHLNKLVGNKLQGFEKIKNVYIALEPFTMDNCLTPSMKIKRLEARKLFEAELAQLYKEDLDAVKARL